MKTNRVGMWVAAVTIGLAMLPRGAAGADKTVPGVAEMKLSHFSERGSKKLTGWAAQVSINTRAAAYRLGLKADLKVKEVHIRIPWYGADGKLNWADAKLANTGTALTTSNHFLYLYGIQPSTVYAKKVNFYAITDVGRVWLQKPGQDTAPAQVYQR